MTLEHEEGGTTVWNLDVLTVCLAALKFVNPGKCKPSPQANFRLKLSIFLLFPLFPLSSTQKTPIDL